MKRIIKHLKENWLWYLTVAMIGISAFNENYIALSMAECAYLGLCLGEIKNEIRNKE